MVEKFRKDLMELKATYDSGEMMSLRESISGSLVCKDVIDEFYKVDQMLIPDLNKIGRVRLYVESLNPDEIEYGSSICTNLNGIINKYLPQKTKVKKRTNK